jgi:general secretion pathway protein K
MRRTDDGIILVNVLVALALGSALVVLMFTSQDNLIDRTRRAAAATQAEALALGGEASVVAALQRDDQTGRFFTRLGADQRPLYGGDGNVFCDDR